MSTKVFRYFNNTGGLNLRFNELILDEQDAEEVLNLHATSSGSWTSMDVGFVNLNVSPLATGSKITSLYHFKPLTGDPVLLAAAGGKLYTFQTSDGIATELVNGLAINEPMRFVTFSGLLIGCNGVDSPKKWDGSTSVTSLGGWPPVIVGVTPGKPSISEIFSNRLVFSGDTNNPSMVYLSELENPENFTPVTGASSAGAIQVSPGDGQKIMALKTMYLPSKTEEILVIFKERSTYILTGSDADTFAVQKISDEFGAVSARSVVQVGNELMFLSAEGVTSLSTATVQGNITANFVSHKIQPQINNLNLGKLSDSFALHLRNRQEVWWVVSDGGSVQNQRVLVLNYGLGNSWSRRSGISAASGLVIDGKLYTGNYSGIIQQQLKGSSYNGSPIPWVYRTPFYELGSPRVRKRIKDVEVYLKQMATLDINVKFAWDIRRGSRAQQSRTASIVPDTSSSVYNEAVYGADEYGLLGLSIIRLIPEGSGKYFQMELSGNVSDKPVELQGWTITAMYGGLR